MIKFRDIDLPSGAAKNHIAEILKDSGCFSVHSVGELDEFNSKIYPFLPDVYSFHSSIWGNF